MTKVIALLVFLMTLCAIDDSRAFEISKADTLLIAQRVFKNECADEKDCLIEWNKGEDFLSLGIEHFTWYPSNSPNNANEAYNSYLQYAKKSGEHLPDCWIKHLFLHVLGAHGNNSLAAKIIASNIKQS